MERVTYRPALIVVFAVVGLMISTAFNSNAVVEKVESERGTELASAVSDMERERGQLEVRLQDLRARIDDMERTAASEQGILAQFESDMRQARAMAGLTDVLGPGLVVTLEDAGEVPQGDDPNAYLIHDFDVALVVNALFDSGAEAVSINGERIAPTTAVRCAGTTVLVNTARIGSPYEVVAVGDPQRMSDGLLADPAISWLFATGAGVSGPRGIIEERSEVTVKAYRGTLRPNYARPTTETVGVP